MLSNSACPQVAQRGNRATCTRVAMHRGRWGLLLLLALGLVFAPVVRSHDQGLKTSSPGVAAIGTKFPVSIPASGARNLLQEEDPLLCAEDPPVPRQPISRRFSRSPQLVTAPSPQSMPASQQLTEETASAPSASSTPTELIIPGPLLASQLAEMAAASETPSPALEAASSTPGLEVDAAPGPALLPAEAPSPETSS
ncbi:hypothetical protein ABBQ32_001700 [Trebouxia sp. C0010 RCD-2024]